MLTKERFSGDTLGNHRPKRYNKKTESAKHTQTKNALQQEIQSHPPRERRRKEENGESEDQPIIQARGIRNPICDKVVVSSEILDVATCPK
jgi:hypothetical protein